LVLEDVLDALAETLGLSTGQLKAIQSAILVLIVVSLRWAVLRIIHSRIQDPEVWYRARKIATYTSTLLVLFFLLRIWLIQFENFATFLGLLSAGVAIALSDVLKNLAGWAYILARRPFRTGDRVEIGDHAGDVIDIRVFRFSLLEIGNWVHADQSTGRIIHIPNGLVFSLPVANFTEGFSFIWHEIPLLITFESDWKRAEATFAAILTEVAPGISGKAAERIKATAREYRIRYTHLTPAVYVTVQDSGVLLTGRVLVSARQRRAVDQDIWKKLLDAIAADPSVELAYPTVRTVLQDPIRLSNPEQGSSDTTGEHGFV
jgi:small-conductance mechanosensitive channel